jgi:c-di-GMP-binding flagellar brake protein YcgR
MQAMGTYTGESIEGRSLRVGVEVPVKVRRFTGRPGITAMTVDISSGGLGIQLPETTAAGSIVAGDLLAFETSEDFFGIRGLGEVVWVHSDNRRVGISFLDLDERGAALLEGFLSVCS